MQKENLFIEARQLIAEFREQKKMSNVKIAAKVGVSNAILTFINNDQTEMVSEEMLLKIINGLKPKTGFNIIRTSNFNTICGICNDSSKMHKLTAIIGYTGAGKTTALSDYYRNTKDAFYVECKNTMNRKQFFHKVLSEMGINFMGTVYEMVNMIANELNTRKNPLLIIDEAGKLSGTIILDLHDLRNATMNNAGIIMAGCEYFQKNMTRAAEKDKTGYPEFYSRIVNWHILNRPTKAEISAIYENNGLTDNEIIKDFLRLSNYRQVYNSIINERGIYEL
ncbi:DNA-binding Xre family transcriptional regulator [Pedobacter sp. UYP30]|uniref:AAA family ATPase n=1 Tax=Pedobacter sp. UYP30 TaxID=1756400 RepID=UPI0033922105